MAVDDAGLSVRGPAGVSDAEVREQLLVQVQRVFLWRRKHSMYVCTRGHRPRSTKSQSQGDQRRLFQLFKSHELALTLP